MTHFFNYPQALWVVENWFEPRPWLYEEYLELRDEMRTCQNRILGCEYEMYCQAPEIEAKVLELWKEGELTDGSLVEFYNDHLETWEGWKQWRDELLEELKFIHRKVDDFEFMYIPIEIFSERERSDPQWMDYGFTPYRRARE